MFKFYRVVKRVIFVFSLTLFLILNGCGTMKAMKDGGVVGMGEWNKKPEKVIVYPGLMTDVVHVLQHGEWYRMIDFPLSFAADTVLLPYTISSTLIEQNIQNTQKAGQKPEQQY
jgi:uncharacterized protein YceK